MKKIILWTMILTMLLALCACGKKNDAVSVGRLNDGFEDALSHDHYAQEHSDIKSTGDYKDHVYDNLSTALLALEKGEIRLLSVNKSVAEYITAHNEKFEIYELTWMNNSDVTHKFSMLTAEQNTELYALLDGAIQQLKADGTLEQLIAEQLTAYIASDPTPAQLPHFDGAPTYRIAVTGDLPPMDFVTADGHAAGFNVALLSAIANIAQVNFETVQVETGARATALASGSVDAVFWTISNTCQICGAMYDVIPAGTQITESFFSGEMSFIKLK